jgi:methylated-DNA-[protein]-cysteine S-methyltransferase
LLVGTAFQHKVWQALLTIKTGQTISYGELARRIKKPKAVRAVGTALGKNPVPVLLPCHRVIASNGSLGGFTGGLSLKKKLLEIEGHPAPYPLRLSR